jgi:transposase-like protein
MPDPHWTSCVGMVTGIFGTVTGVSGAILGYVNYRKSKMMKKLDLRIELKRAVADLIYEYAEIVRKMKEGNKSRKAVAAPLGLFNSSMMKKWDEEFASDESAINDIAKEIPDENVSYEQLEDKDLEEKLINVHKINRKLQKFSQKYGEAMEWDNKKREEIHQAHLVKLTKLNK